MIIHTIKAILKNKSEATQILSQIDTANWNLKTNVLNTDGKLVIKAQVHAKKDVKKVIHTIEDYFEEYILHLSLDSHNPETNSGWTQSRKYEHNYALS